MHLHDKEISLVVSGKKWIFKDTACQGIKVAADGQLLFISSVDQGIKYLHMSVSLQGLHE